MPFYFVNADLKKICFMMLYNLKSVRSEVLMVSLKCSLLVKLLLQLKVSFAKTKCIHVIICLFMNLPGDNGALLTISTLKKGSQMSWMCLSVAKKIRQE